MKREHRYITLPELHNLNHSNQLDPPSLSIFCLGLSIKPSFFKDVRINQFWLSGHGTRDTEAYNYIWMGKKTSLCHKSNNSYGIETEACYVMWLVYLDLTLITIYSERCTEHLNQQTASGEAACRGVIVQGEPGTGKSCATWAWLLQQVTKNKTFLWIHLSPNGSSCVEMSNSQIRHALFIRCMSKLLLMFYFSYIF